MSKEMSVIVLGIWLVILPYLGIPHSSWLFTLLIALTGIALIVCGLLLRSEAIGARPGRRVVRNASFVESVPQRQDMPQEDIPSSLPEVADEGRKEGINSLN